MPANQHNSYMRITNVIAQMLLPFLLISVKFVIACLAPGEPLFNAKFVENQPDSRWSHLHLDVNIRMHDLSMGSIAQQFKSEGSGTTVC